MRDPLDDLLAEANEALTPVPAGLTQRIDGRLRLARRLRLATRAAAVVVAVALVWFAGHATMRPERHDPPPVEQPVGPPSEAAPTPFVRVTFPPAARVKAVPVAAESPNVTVLWLFPGRPALPPAPAPADDPPSPPERNDS